MLFLDKVSYVKSCKIIKLAICTKINISYWKWTKKSFKIIIWIFLGGDNSCEITWKTADIVVLFPWVLLKQFQYLKIILVVVKLKIDCLTKNKKCINYVN